MASMPLSPKTRGRIENRLRESRKNRKGGLIAFLNAGDPSLDDTGKIIRLFDDSGVDVVELGVPYPHPFTDGQVIARSHARAIKKGIQIEDVLDMVSDLRSECTIPIVLLTEFAYTVKPRNLKPFLSACKDAQIDGILLHCLPPFLLGEYCNLSLSFELETIFGLYPNTKEERKKLVYETANGFIYLATSYGRTGRENAISKATLLYFRKVRQEIDVPLAAGHGVRDPHDLQLIYSTGVDAAIVGTPVMSIVDRHHQDPGAIYSEMESLLRLMTGQKTNYTFGGE